MRPPWLALAALAAAPVLAQHHQHGGGSPSPYSGQQYRDIKALSADEVRDLQNGAGMGFAKAAELNRHPGPQHALENRRALGLTDEQTQRLAALLTRHKERARALGERVVGLERELDQLFASGKADAASVDRLTATIAEATGRLRAEHLKTHLETTAILTPEQVARYESARGYAPGAGHGTTGPVPGAHGGSAGHGSSPAGHGSSPAGHGSGAQAGGARTSGHGGH